MKRQKLLRLMRQIREEVQAEPSQPVTFDTLSVNFVSRTVRFRGRTIIIEAQAVEFPVLSTDRLIITKNGEDVL